MAENLLDKVFLEVWREAAKFPGHLRMSTWLLIISRNRAMAVLRRRQREETHKGTAEALEDPADDPKLVFLNDRRFPLSFSRLADLSEDHREMLDLVYYHGQSIDEVAQILGVAPKTVRARMFNARKRIEARLAKAGADATLPN